MKLLAAGFALVTLLAASLAVASTSIHPSAPETQGTTTTQGTTEGSGEDTDITSAREGPTPTALALVERSQKTKGATTIEWDSAFLDLDYTLGDTFTVTVAWDVLSGAAAYDSFDLKGKGFTPVARRDPATGELVTVVHSGNSVSFDIGFDELHWDDTRQVDIGNAHLKLYLLVDEDGDGTAELLAGFGVNIHVEDPA